MKTVDCRPPHHHHHPSAALTALVMFLKWSDHSQDVMAGLSGLLARQFLLDITLSAEGRTIKAHAVVLASVSKYFEVRGYHSTSVHQYMLLDTQPH